MRNAINSSIGYRSENGDLIRKLAMTTKENVIWFA